MTHDSNATEYCNYPQLIEDIQESGGTAKITGWTRVVIIFAFVTLSTIGALGNFCLIVTMFSNKDKRSSIRCAFAINLAVSDLILCVFTQPLNLLQQLDRQWRYGSVLCKLVPTIQSVNVFTSSFSITAIAIDRLHAVLQPYVKRPKQSSRSTTVCICAIWLVAIVLSIPLVFFYSTTKFPPEHIVVEYFSDCREKVNVFDQCIYDGDGATERLYVGYTLASLFVWFFLNCIAVLIAHLCIWFRIVKSRNRMANANRSMLTGQSTDVLHTHETSAKCKQTTTAQAVTLYRRRKAKCLLIAIVVTFIISWLPINLLNLATDIEKLTRPATNQTNDLSDDLAQQILEDVEATVLNNLLAPLCNGLIFLSACLNPIFYGWLNDSCRRQFMSCYERRETAAENRQLHDSDANSGEQRNAADARNNGRCEMYLRIANTMETTQNVLTPTAEVAVDTV